MRFTRCLLIGAALFGANISPLFQPSRAQEPVSEAQIAATKIGRRVILIARPFDANRPVTAVRFLLDGNTLAEAGAPGRWDWDTSNLRQGRHVVQVQAFSGEAFIGQSEPMAVYVTDGPASVLEVPFFTYEGEGRRPQQVVAPRISTSGRIAPTSEPSGRVGSALIEVFLNGEKQEFAPAARLASAEELAPKPVVKRSRSRRERQRLKRLAILRAQSAKASRTVWIPARPLLQKLGAQLHWREAKQTLVADLRIAGGVRRLELTAGEDGTRARIDGRQIALKSPVRQADNALMVPISFCAQALDLRVSYQPQQRRVELFTPISPM
ncbi:MAG TPA: stalk domain-containing protein [Abditibacteriaceae bacterium]